MSSNNTTALEPEVTTTYDPSGFLWLEPYQYGLLLLTMCVVFGTIVIWTIYIISTSNMLKEKDLTIFYLIVNALVTDLGNISKVGYHSYVVLNGAVMNHSLPVLSEAQMYFTIGIMDCLCYGTNLINQATIATSRLIGIANKTDLSKWTYIKVAIFDWTLGASVVAFHYIVEGCRWFFEYGFGVNCNLPHCGDVWYIVEIGCIGTSITCYLTIFGIILYRRWAHTFSGMKSRDLTVLYIMFANSTFQVLNSAAWRVFPAIYGVIDLCNALAQSLFLLVSVRRIRKRAIGMLLGAKHSLARSTLARSSTKASLVALRRRSSVAPANKVAVQPAAEPGNN